MTRRPTRLIVPGQAVPALEIGGAVIAFVRLVKWTHGNRERLRLADAWFVQSGHQAGDTKLTGQCKEQKAHDFREVLVRSELHRQLVQGFERQNFAFSIERFA
jgi:hypothetical protein